MSQPAPPAGDVDGKVALVVGGSRYQGAAIAENIASRGADTSNADFDHMIGLNTRSAFYTLRAAVRHLAENGCYVVLSTALTSIMTGAYGLYSGSKAAIELMVLAAAKETRGAGHYRQRARSWPGRRLLVPCSRDPESIEAATHHSPRNRLGDPEVLGSMRATGWTDRQQAIAVAGAPSSPARSADSSPAWDLSGSP